MIPGLPKVSLFIYLSLSGDVLPLNRRVEQRSARSEVKVFVAAQVARWVSIKSLEEFYCEKLLFLGSRREVKVRHQGRSVTRPRGAPISRVGFDSLLRYTETRDLCVGVIWPSLSMGAQSPPIAADGQRRPMYVTSGLAWVGEPDGGGSSTGGAAIVAAQR